MATPPIALSKAETAWLDFEKPIQELEEELSKLRQIQDKGKSDVSGPIRAMETQIQKTKKQLYSQLTGWQKVQLSRHLDRPYTLFYVEHMTTDFVELHGDRCYGDDKAIVGGFAIWKANRSCSSVTKKASTPKCGSTGTLGWPTPKGTVKH